MALIDDPKVQNLIEKEVTKAVKAETKRIVAAVKEVMTAKVEEAKVAGDKAGAKALSQLAKELTFAMKPEA